jgi:hypothetical protein
MDDDFFYEADKTIDKNIRNIQLNWKSEANNNNNFT